MHSSWTESEEQIQRRKDRILRDAPRAQRAREILEKLFPGFAQAQRINRFKRAAQAYLNAGNGTDEEIMKALREFRAVLAELRTWEPTTSTGD